VLVTHDHGLAAEAQRQVVLKDGRVISDTENGRRGDAARRDAEIEGRGDGAKVNS